jgi:cell division transport system ATP-binding protein
LVHNPKFIIADEPTGNLDWEASKKIADTLIELNKAGHTILFITHDLALLDYVKSKYPKIRVEEIKRG